MTLVWSNDWSFVGLPSCTVAANKGSIDDFVDERPIQWLEIPMEDMHYGPRSEIRVHSVQSKREELLLSGWMGWMESTHELWVQRLRSSYRMKTTYLDEKIRPRFCFLFGDEETAERIAWNYSSQHLFGYDAFNDEFWERYGRVRKLYENYGEDCTSAPSIPIRLSFRPRDELPQRSQAKYLHTIVELLTNVLKATEKSKREHPDRPRFELDSIDLIVGSFVVSPAVVKELQAILAMDVKIHLFVLPTDLSRKDVKQPHKWRSKWATLLSAVCGHPNTPTERCNQIDELRVFFSGGPDDMVYALCSLVVHTKNIRIFGMEGSAPAGDGVTFWRWMIYALFSRASTSTIEALRTFMSKITRDCGDGGFKLVADAKYPQTQLLSNSTAAEDVHIGSVHLPQGVRIQLSDDEMDTYLVRTEGGESFEMIRRDESMVNVIVPGYGLGFIDRALCADKRQRVSPQLSSDPVTRTTIQHMDLLRADAKELLPYSGVGIESLRIGAFFGYEDPVSVVEFSRILSSCPKLRTLVFSRPVIASLQPLTEAYSNGCCIKSLIFDDCAIRDNESVVKFLGLLADPKSNAAKYLEVLVLNNETARDGHISVAIARALADVVYHNTHLRLIQAFLQPSVFEVYQNRLDEIKGMEDTNIAKCVPIRLPSRAKCAFLSTFPHRQHGTNAPVDSRVGLPHHLDMRATSIIFEFAAEAVVAQVIVCKIVERRYHVLDFFGLNAFLDDDDDDDEVDDFLEDDEIDEDDFDDGPGEDFEE